MKNILFVFILFCTGCATSNTYYDSLPNNYKTHDADFKLYIRKHECCFWRYLRLYDNYLVIEDRNIKEGYASVILRYDSINKNYTNGNLVMFKSENGILTKVEEVKKGTRSVHYSLAKPTQIMDWNNMKNSALGSAYYDKYKSHNYPFHIHGFSCLYPYEDPCKQTANIATSNLKYCDSIAKKYELKY